MFIKYILTSTESDDDNPTATNTIKPKFIQCFILVIFSTVPRRCYTKKTNELDIPREVKQKFIELLN